MTTDPTSQQAENPAAHPTAPPTVPPATPNADQHAASSRSRLVRRSDDRLLAGVCSGLADHLGLDPTLVRLITVLVTVLGFGTVVIAYLVAWVIVPADTSVGPRPVGAPRPYAG
jgi:phage shock protein C